MAGAQDLTGANDEKAREAAARRILSETPLIDGHNDLPWQLRERVHGRLDRLDLSADLSQLTPMLATDIPRLRAGMVGGQFWSVYVPVELEAAAAVQAMFEQIDLVHRMAARYPDAFAMAVTADDVTRIHKAGRLACLIGVEGGHSIGDSLALVRQAYACGARAITLTHWKNTAWADAATDKPVHGGLTRFGREVVREMNRLGMLVDLAHVSDKTMLDALATSEAPVIFSHSSARALCNHVRNVPDEVLRNLAANGGVAMVNFAPGFVSEPARLVWEQASADQERLRAAFPGDPERVKRELVRWDRGHPAPKATLAEVADHVEHVRRVAGIDHVGLGSDFDGISATPVGLEDVSRYPALLAELMRRGWSAADLRKLAGENLLRAMRAAERTAARLQRERPASEARIEELDPPPAGREHAPEPRGSR